MLEIVPCESEDAGSDNARSAIALIIIFENSVRFSEDAVNAMNRIVWTRGLRALTKGLELLYVLGIDLDTRFHHRMLVAHEENQDRQAEPLRSLKLQFGDRQAFGVHVANGCLSVAMAHNQHVSNGVVDHLERGLDDVAGDVRPGKLHADGTETALENRVEGLLPMLLEIGEGARHHDGAIGFFGRQAARLPAQELGIAIQSNG